MSPDDMPINSMRDEEPCLTVEQELLKSKDKTIQLLANALKDTADLLGKQPTYMGSRDEKYRKLAEKYLND